MPFIRSLTSKRYTYIVAVILLLSKIIPTYSWCVLKRLVYITIIALLSYQPSFYIKCTKLSIHLSCDIKLISNAECAYFMRPYILQSLRLFCLIYLKVLYNNYCEKA